MTTKTATREISLITGCTIEQATEVLKHLEKINVNTDLGKVKCSEFSAMANRAFEAIEKI